MAETIVYLRPNIIFKGDNITDNITDNVAIDKMHHRAHQEYFIANSVITEIIVQPYTKSSREKSHYFLGQKKFNMLRKGTNDRLTNRKYEFIQ